MTAIARRGEHVTDERSSEVTGKGSAFRLPESRDVLVATLSCDIFRKLFRSR